MENEIIEMARGAPGWRAAVIGGLAAGALDFAAAVVNSGKSPLLVGQAIATGWLGAASYQGGAGSAALGTASHFAILLVVAAIYVAASRQMTFLWRQPLLCGLVFGVIVYALMNSVVVPLSNTPMGSPSDARRLIQIAIHMVCVGLPIALAAWRVR
jgi:hypothetical protein